MGVNRKLYRAQTILVKEFFLQRLLQSILLILLNTRVCKPLLDEPVSFIFPQMHVQ
jgi:hypothetical protein